MKSSFNAQNQPPVVQPAPMAELHPTIAGICRSFHETLGQQESFTPSPAKPIPHSCIGVKDSCEESYNAPDRMSPSAPLVFSKDEALSGLNDSCFPEAMRCPVTVGTNVRRPDHIEHRDISYVMTAIKEGRYESIDLKTRINNIRTAVTEEGARYAKSQLPWFCGAYIREKRSNENVTSARFMIFDLDHVKDIEAIKQKAVLKFPWLRYAFHSVTDGVKLVAMMNKPLTDERKFRAIYAYLCLQIETLLLVPCDNTPDWARACFFSYDPELIDNLKNLKPLDVEDYYRQAVSFREFQRGSNMLSRSNLRHSPDTHFTPSSTGAKDSCVDIGNPCDRMSPSAPIVCSKDKAQSGLNDSCYNSADDYAKAEKVVAVLSKLHIDRQDWIKIGFALYAAFGERGKPLWDMFVDNPNYNDTQRKIDLHWNSFKNVRSITISSLFYIADKYGVSHE